MRSAALSKTRDAGPTHDDTSDDVPMRFDFCPLKSNFRAAF
jgi:hypothetical protein